MRTPERRAAGRLPAESATLTALASGPAEAEAVSRSLLTAFSSRVLWLGATGEGSKLKLVMNGWVLGLVALTAETMALSAGLGLPVTSFLDIIRGGPLDVDQAHIKGLAMATSQYAPALPLRLAAKDAELIVAAGREAEIDLAVASAVAGRLRAALAAGHGDEDVAAIWYAIAPSRVISSAARQIDLDPDEPDIEEMTT